MKLNLYFKYMLGLDHSSVKLDKIILHSLMAHLMNQEPNITVTLISISDVRNHLKRFILKKSEKIEIQTYSTKKKKTSKLQTSFKNRKSFPKTEK